MYLFFEIQLYKQTLNYVLASARDSSGKPAYRNVYKKVQCICSLTGPLEARGRLGTDSLVPLRLAGQAAKNILNWVAIFVNCQLPICQLLPAAFAYCLFFFPSFVK
jgi:hypothetical protein